jgi:cytochrome c
MKWAFLPFIALLAAHTQTPPAGKVIFEKRCGGCHALDRDKEGPRLSGVFGRRAGAVTGFEYSTALKNAKITWDAATLDQWLTDTESLVANNEMAFRVDKAEERRDIIEYLRTLPSNFIPASRNIVRVPR